MPIVLLIAALALATLGVGPQGHADAPPPLVDPPKDASRLTDAITRLARDLDAGAVSLSFDADRGYLPAILKALRLPVSSQVLVFSKTSLQHQAITPRTPRAIYFNDDVYVGYVPDGRLLEMSAVDPVAGPVFYTISQAPAARPRLVTNADCVQCHATPATLNVPGYLVRSVFTRPDGQVAPRTSSFLSDHTSPIEERWGGWYVTGTFAGGTTHMGNAFLRAGEEEATFDRAPGTGARDLSTRFQTARYPSVESDAVALMVLEHQTRMHNHIARLHHHANAGSPIDADVEALVRYTLFADEAPLRGRIAGTTDFARTFERLGPVDAQGRSLRQFDLRTRLFRYPCSYLIYSDAFQALPTLAKRAVYARIKGVLSGRAADATYARLTGADRVAVLEILNATVPSFAAEP